MEEIQSKYVTANCLLVDERQCCIYCLQLLYHITVQNIQMLKHSLTPCKANGT